MSITVFLALDGVVHPTGTLIDKTGTARCIHLGTTPFECASHLRRLADRHDVQFVIYSSWLQKMSLEQLRAQAPEWMRSRIVGACAEFETRDEIQRVTRTQPMREVVLDYVQSQGIRAWVALDTTFDGWAQDDGLDSHVVVCDSALGLSDGLTRQLLEDVARREGARMTTCDSSCEEKPPVNHQEGV